MLNVHQKDWCWSWSSNTWATWCIEQTYWRRLWCWRRLRAEGEGGDRGRDVWIASLTQWIWVWENSRRLWRTEAWHAAVHGVVKSQTRLSDWTTVTNLAMKTRTPKFKNLCHLLLLKIIMPKCVCNQSCVIFTWWNYKMLMKEIP